MPTPSPSQAIHAAAQTLNEHQIALTDLRRGLASFVLPSPAANDRLDHADDLLAILASQLNRAADILSDELERIEAANAREARAVDRDFQRWNVAVGITKRVVANDDMTRLTTALKGGVL
jgi:hypothetical protein